MASREENREGRTEGRQALPPAGEQAIFGPAGGRPPASRSLAEPDTVREAVSGLTAGLSQLVRGHLALARVEMTRDVKALGKDSAMGMSGVPVLLVGYLLLWMGLGYLLALALPAWAAFLICAGANFAAGAALLLWGRSRLKREKLALPATAQEVRRDREWVSTLREPPETLRGRLQ